MDYFYDAQIRRALIQFTRIFGGFSYSELDSTGKQIIKKVRFMYAATNSQVQNIINNNSENTLTTLPIFSVYLDQIKQSHRRRQDPTFVSRKNVTERAIDPETKAYTSESGNKYTVEMLMPVAYDLTVKVDLITSNESQKMQLLEQIFVLFNPEVEIQTSVNPVDWTALTTVTLTDINITPAANNSTINDMTTLTFLVPIYINPPVKVKRSSIIREIIINIGSEDNFSNNVDVDGNLYAPGEVMHTSVVTPDMAYLSVTRCYKSKNIYYADLAKDTDGSQSEVTWKTLFASYGEFNDGKSLIYLLQNIVSYDKDKNFYIGNVAKDSSNPYRLILTIDPNTLPHSLYPDNTITQIINPEVTYPSNMTIKKNDSFLLLENIAQNTKEWGTIYCNNVAVSGNYGAMKNDIITWDGTKWNITFNSQTISEDEIVYYTNTNNGDYLNWDSGWRMSIEAVYAPGYWKIKA